MSSQQNSSSHRGVLSRWVRRVGGSLKTSFAVFGLVSAVGLYYQYRQTFPPEEDDGDKKKKPKKKVLVLPFDRIELVEKKKRGVWDGFSQRTTEWGEEDKENRSLRVEVRELVDLIHRAASDPDIVALYGSFSGLTGNMSRAGWSDLEDLRNALRVFKESHRVHSEPNLKHREPADNVCPRKEKKLLYCYSDTFESLADPSNKDYYLASEFTHVHMQKHGALNLFGLSSQHFFLRDCFQKYGITAHVFKHGQYKNAANIFTEKSVTKPHRENVLNILKTLNRGVCQDIWECRKSKATVLLPPYLRQQLANDPKGQEPLRNFDWDQFWKRIHESGTFTAATALKAGLVDFLPRRDPLADLLKGNAAAKAKDGDVDNNSDSKGNEEEGSESESNAKDTNIDKASKEDDESPIESSSVEKAVRSRWNADETDFDAFKACEAVSLEDYSKQVSKKKKTEERQWKVKRYSLQHPSVAYLLSTVGIIEKVTDQDREKLEKKKEKVALLTVEGTIGEDTARKLMSQIRKIRKDQDTKCIVLRVVSPGGIIQPCETILNEIKALDIPCVCSIGNVAASGGYYISAPANRIFCSRKSVTGSIGVFGVRFDLRKMAAQYGISVDTVNADGTGASDPQSLANLVNPFAPMTRKMKQNFSESMDRHYHHFKDVVAEERGLSIDTVEELAQGRVWTGEQAKINGLVDELGGLHRAIAYAMRNYTSGEAEVVVWPKPKSLVGRLFSSGGVVCAEDIVPDSPVPAATVNDTAMRGLAELLWRMASSPSTGGLPGTFSAVVLAADENTAIRCLVQANARNVDTGSKWRLSTLLPQDFWD